MAGKRPTAPRTASAAQRPTLSVGVAQPVLISLDVAANALAHAAAVRAAGARIMVFPELSLTGYELDAPAIASDDPRLAPIVEACAETGAIALVGAPFRDEGGAEFIAMLVVDGDGVRVAYRKVWLGEVEQERVAGGILFGDCVTPLLACDRAILGGHCAGDPRHPM